MTSGARALVWPGVATAVLFGLLMSLGLWQVRRLGEKEALIARVESRAHVAPAEAPPRDKWATSRAARLRLLPRDRERPLSRRP